MNYKSEIPPTNTLSTSPLNHKEHPSGWQRFLWWLAAADEEIMLQCGPDKFRFSVIGYTVLTTWIFATLAWGYFFSTVAPDPIIYIPAALFFGFVILTIDRGLIAGINSNTKFKWLSVAFRMVLALTIGFFLSQPVVLMLFNKDIDAHLPIVQARQSAKYQQQLRDENATALSAAKATIHRIRNEQKTKEQEILDLKNAYIKETDGTGGSGKVGEHQIAKVKKAAYLKAEDDFVVWKRNQQPEQDSAMAREKRTEDEIMQRLTAFQKGQSDGFLSRIETLDDLMLEHPPVKYRYRIILVLIMLIELMPLITKLMMRSGMYEERLAMANEEEKNRLGVEKLYVQEVEKEFYKQALQADKSLQGYILEEMNKTKLDAAKNALNEWREQPENARGFWNILKQKLLYFTR